MSPDEDAAVAHLRAADPVLRALIDRVGPWTLAERTAGYPREHFGMLVRSIVGQQVSTASAAAIFARLTNRFGGRAPTPEEVLADDPEELRAAAGLSRPKLRYLRALAEHVVSGRLELDALERLSDEQVIAELTAVKGIGLWSAQIFLMFQLRRPDVLAVGDLAIRRAMMLTYALDALPAAAEMEAIAEPWRPHRTRACLFLWRSLNATPA